MRDLQNDENDDGSSYVYFDIETTDLDPRQSRVLTVAALFGNDEQSKIVGREREAERYILQHTLSWLSLPLTYVGFSSSRFDIPFLNYRLKVHRMPTIKLANHIDLQKLLPRKRNGHPASLEDECKKRGIISKSTPFNEILWIRAKSGEPKAIEAVAQHNIEDVISLRELFRAMNNENKEPDPIEVFENEGGPPPVEPWDTAWLERVRPNERRTTTATQE